MGIQLQPQSMLQREKFNLPSRSNIHLLTVAIRLTLPKVQLLFRLISILGNIHSCLCRFRSGYWLIKSVTSLHHDLPDPRFQQAGHAKRSRIALIAQGNGGIIHIRLIVHNRGIRQIHGFFTVLLRIKLAHNIILAGQLCQNFLFSYRPYKILVQ